MHTHRSSRQWEDDGGVVVEADRRLHGPDQHRHQTRDSRGDGEVLARTYTYVPHVHTNTRQNITSARRSSQKATAPHVRCKRARDRMASYTYHARNGNVNATQSRGVVGIKTNQERAIVGVRSPPRGSLCISALGRVGGHRNLQDSSGKIKPNRHRQSRNNAHDLKRDHR